MVLYGRLVMNKDEYLCKWCAEFIKEWYESEGELMDDKCPIKDICDQATILEWKREIEHIENMH